MHIKFSLCGSTGPDIWHWYELRKTVWWQHRSWHDTDASLARLCGGSTGPDMTRMPASQDCVVAAPALTWHRCELRTTVVAALVLTWHQCQLHKTVWWQHRSWHMRPMWASQDCVVAAPVLTYDTDVSFARLCGGRAMFAGCSPVYSMMNIASVFTESGHFTRVVAVWSLGNISRWCSTYALFPHPVPHFFLLNESECIHTHIHMSPHVWASFLHFRHTRKDECIDQLKTNLEKMTALISWKPI